jgi:hypothetical protein
LDQGSAAHISTGDLDGRVGQVEPVRLAAAVFAYDERSGMLCLEFYRVCTASTSRIRLAPAPNA